MKKIIHIDADCFFAAVETHENPKYCGIPLAVGGSADKRGVIATCNYEARRFGIHSAMSSAMAIKRCPQLTIVRPRMSVYRQYSERMRGIFLDYTEKIEPLSLDEAFLDVSNSQKLRGSATLIAKEIQTRIVNELGITVSAGIAPVKFLAKVASDWNKPNGFCLIEPSEVSSFIRPLSVKKLPGVGPVGFKKLTQNGIFTCQDIQERGLPEMIRLCGSFGPRLFQMANGEDDREVSVSGKRKSVSVERTFSTDLDKIDGHSQEISDLFSSLMGRWEKISARHQIIGMFVKLKFHDFTVTTLETRPNLDGVLSIEPFELMFQKAWSRKKIPIRLMGMGFKLKARSEVQMEFPFS